MATKQKEVKLSKRTKRCGFHKEDHSIDLFGSDKREKDGKSVWCKAAWSEYHKARKANKAAGVKVKGQKVTKVSPKSSKPVATKKTAKTTKSAKAVKTSSEVVSQ